MGLKLVLKLPLPRVIGEANVKHLLFSRFSVNQMAIKIHLKNKLFTNTLLTGVKSGMHISAH